jgi:hypothetical protein
MNQLTASSATRTLADRLLADLLFFFRTMYIGYQDDARISPVFYLYLPLLALNSGSGGQLRAHLKTSKVSESD